jgi:hypothetical protein
MASTILNFNFKDNSTVAYIVSILLNIFAGSFILSVTSFVNYYICRRYLLRDIMNECLKYSQMFSKLEYFIPKKYHEEDLNVIKVKNKKEFIEQYKSDLEFDNKHKLEQVLKEYISLSETSTRQLWNMYDDLDFITDVRNKKKQEYWKNIFNYIYSNICIIKEYSYHFKIYMAAINGNYKVNEEKLLELQDKIFFCKKYNYDNGEEVKDILSKLEVGYETISGGNSKEFTLVYNETSNYLLKMFDAVGKDNYFNKNYSGLGSDDDDE